MLKYLILSPMIWILFYCKRYFNKNIRDGNPSIFWIGFGFLQKSDFIRIADSWNFSGLRIFGFGLQILGNIFKCLFINKNYVLNFTFFRIVRRAFFLFTAPTADILKILT